jgi:hypothetical protein
LNIAELGDRRHGVYSPSLSFDFVSELRSHESDEFKFFVDDNEDKKKVESSSLLLDYNRTLYSLVHKKNALPFKRDEVLFFLYFVNIVI